MGGPWVDVRGATKFISVTPTITTSAYTAKDSVGGAITLTKAIRIRGGTGVLETLSVVDKASQEAELIFHFFKNAPTATDNSVFDPTDAQLVSDWMGTVTLTNYITLNDNSVATVRNIGLVLEADTSTAQDNNIGLFDIYVVATTSGTPTYVSSSDLVFKFGILQD